MEIRTKIRILSHGSNQAILLLIGKISKLILILGITRGLPPTTFTTTANSSEVFSEEG
jgi:hypothetical protein